MSTRRHLVITLHGIRTFGKWQDRLETLLKKHDKRVSVSKYRYGYFSVLAFLFPFLRGFVTRDFRKHLRLIKDGQWDRIDIVAHSFGTHLVGWGLRGLKPDERPKIHTVIFAGSVLKQTFPWHDLIPDCVGRVINDCGLNDKVLLINQFFVLLSGMAGRIGFAGLENDQFVNRYFSFGHGGYFETDGISNDFMATYWLPLLLTDEIVVRHDERITLTVFQGFLHFLANNAEPLKILMTIVPLIALLFWIYGLYINSEHQKHVAQQAERTAERNASEARQMTALAQQRADESKQSLVKLYVSTGVQLIDSGDTFGSLPWLMKALDFEAGNPSRENLHRTRLRSILERCPRLLNMWFHSSEILDIQFTGDRHKILAVAKNGARMWNANTGEPVSPVLGPLSSSVELSKPSISTDGRKIAIAGNAVLDPLYEVQIWDTTSDKSTEAIYKEDDKISKALLSNDGAQLLTISSDKVRLRRLTKPTPLALDVRWVRDALFSPNGQLVATIGGTFNNEEISVYTSTEGIRTCGPVKYAKSIDHVSFSPDSKRIAILTSDGEISIFEATTGKKLAAIDKPFDPVTELWFTPDGSQLVASGGIWENSGPFLFYNLPGQEWSIQSFDPASGKKLGQEMKFGGATAGWFSSDKALLATADDNSHVYIWDWRQRKQLAGPILMPAAVKNIILGPDDARIALVDKKNGVRVWDIRTGNPITPILPHESSITNVVFSPDARCLLTATTQGVVRLWDTVIHQEGLSNLEETSSAKHLWISNRQTVALVEQGSAVSALSMSDFHSFGRKIPLTSAITAAEVSADAKLVAIGGAKSLRVWKLDMGAPVTLSLSTAGDAIAVQFRNGNGQISMASNDGSINTWDLISGAQLGTPLQVPAISEARFSADGNMLVTGASDGSSYAINLQDHHIVQVLAPVPAPRFAGLRQENHSSHVAISSDGRWGAIARDSEVHLWDLKTRVQSSVFNAVYGHIDSIRFSPDGKHLLFVAGSQAARVWDVQSGASVSPHLRHSDVFDAAYSPDGKLILTVAPHSLQLWDAATSTLVTIASEVSSNITGAVCSLDGSRVLTLLGTKLQMWAIAPDKRPMDQLRAVSITLGLHSIDQTGASVPVDVNVLRAAWQEQKDSKQTREPDTNQRLQWYESEAASDERYGYWRAAVFHLDRLVEEEPKSFSIHLRRANALERALLLPEALAEYKRLAVIDPKNIGALQGIGRISAQNRKWEDAAAAWSLLAEGHPGISEYLVARGNAYAELGRLEDASKDFELAEKKPKLTSNDSAAPVIQLDRLSREIPYRYALARLGAGDHQSYRKTCAAMIPTLKDSDFYSPDNINLPLWTCSLTKGALDNFDYSLKLGNRLLAEFPDCVYCFNSIAALLYRAGQYQAAIDKLQKAMLLQGGNGSIWDYLFLAMANQQLSNTAEARIWAQRVDRMIASAGLTDHEDQPNSLPWDVRLQLSLLSQEMHAILGEQK